MTIQKLLPYDPHSHNSITAFNFRLNQHVQSLLINANSTDGKLPKLKIVVKNGQFFLKLDDNLFKLDKFKEPTKIDLYKQSSASEYQNIASITSKLTVTSSSPILPINTTTTTVKKSRSSTPNPNSSTTTKSKPSAPIKASTPTPSSKDHTTTTTTNQITNPRLLTITKRLTHLLALGPITLEEIQKRTRIPQKEIESVIDTISMPYQPDEQTIKNYPNMKNLKKDTEYHVLKYSNYKDLKINDWKYNDKDLSIVRNNCHLAFDHCNYPKDHQARRYLQKKNDGIDEKDKGNDHHHHHGELNRLPSKTPSISITTKSVTNGSVEKKLESNNTNSNNTNSVTNGSVEKRSESNNTNNNDKKRKRQEEEYLQDLAKRFKSKYKEYETLYSKISHSPKQDQIEVSKLIELHKNLESWKTQLWNSVKD